MRIYPRYTARQPHRQNTQHSAAALLRQSIYNRRVTIVSAPRSFWTEALVLGIERSPSHEAAADPAEGEIMGFFNRTEAVKYAFKWALGRNPAFPNYSANHGGGDCTSFISQVMLAGGWPMRLGPSWLWSYWWCYDGEASRTWASANWFSKYLDATPRTWQCEMDDLWPGDIVQMQAPPFKQPDHTMVVTRRTSDGIFLTYHSTDTYQRSLQDIQAHYPSETKYFYWKVLDLFPDPDEELRQAIEARGHIGNKI